MERTNAIKIKDLNKIVEEVTEPIISTMGPRGSNVMRVHIKSHPSVTKDGVSVASGIRPIDTGTFSEGVINLVLQSCDSTRNQIGDGTTTTALIIRSIIDFVDNHQGSYVDDLVRFELKSGIETACSKAIDIFKELAIDATKEDLDNNLYISMNNNHRLIDMLKQIDIVTDKPLIVHGDVDLVNKENKPTFHASTLYDLTGIKIHGEYKCLCMDYVSLLHNYLDRKIDTDGTLIVFTTADDDFTRALQTNTSYAEMVYNYINGVSNVLPILLHGDNSKRFDNPLSKLVDIAFVTGCETIVSYGDYNYDNADKYIGNVIIDKFEDDELIIGNAYDRPTELIEYLELLKSQVTSAEDARLLEKRIINLTSGKPLLSISGTKAEYKEAFDILDDGISAYRAITKYNKVVIGAGNTQLKAGLYLDDMELDLTPSEQLGYDAVVHALKSISDRLIGKSYTVDDALNFKSTKGYNLNGEVEDLYAKGIVESLYGQERSLINGANTAAQLLTLEYCLIDMKKH